MSTGIRSLRRILARISWLRQARSRWDLRGPGGMRKVFRQIHRSGFWGGSESVSGPGSDLVSTEHVQKLVKEMVRLVSARTLLDAPCGDFNWMRRVDLPETAYTGLDIVPELIAENRRRFESPCRRFLLADLTRSELPRADLILCRDCMVHLPFRDALRAIASFRRAGSYLLATTFPNTLENRDIALGEWRALDLQRPPFSFPVPIRCELEHSDPRWRTKSLGLWRLADL